MTRTALYHLTPAGSRLANYLLYCESTPVTLELQFADARIVRRSAVPASTPPVPPEQHDDDRQPPEPKPPKCATCGRPLNAKGLCWLCDAPGGSGFFDDDFEPEED